MSDEFKVHRLNETGLLKADTIARAFETCLASLSQVIPQGRERALVVTKLQEASFFAKRAIALETGNQQGNWVCGGCGAESHFAPAQCACGYIS